MSGSLIGSLIINTIAFVALAELLPGFKIRRWTTAAIMAVVYAVLNATLGKVIMIVGLAPFIAVPIIGWAMIPLVYLVLAFGIAVVVLMVTDEFMEDFEMTGTDVAVKAALGMGVINFLLRIIF